MDRFRRGKIWIAIISFIFGYITNSILNLNHPPGTKQELKQNEVQPTSNEVFLVIFIFSSVSNSQRRNVLRETWLSNYQGHPDVKYYFVVSGGDLTEHQQSLLTEELATRNDLLIFTNIEDTFYTLTSKLLASLSWVAGKPDGWVSAQEKPFRNFKYVLKCDDDSYVKVGDVVKELKSMSVSSKSDSLYWGFFDGRAEVKKTGKYKEKDWVICDRYLPYALGGGYVIARNLVQFVASNSKYWKKYKSEDVSLGAWLSSYDHINRFHDPRFDTEYISRGCHQSYLVTHKHSENALRVYYNNLKQTGFLCRKEYRSRLSYAYNWSVLPSKCCNRSNANTP